MHLIRKPPGGGKKNDDGKRRLSLILTEKGELETKRITRLKWNCRQVGVVLPQLASDELDGSKRISPDSRDALIAHILNCEPCGLEFFEMPGNMDDIPIPPLPASVRAAIQWVRPAGGEAQPGKNEPGGKGKPKGDK